MKRVIKIRALLVIYTMITFSCSNQGPIKENEQLNSSNQKSIKKHEQLIYFKSQFVMDMDEVFDRPEKEYQRLTDNINFYPETDTIKYENDAIHISYLTYVNACADYSGDIEIRNDSLILKAKNILDEECASGRIDRFIYEIYNPENRKYIIVKY